MPRFLIVSLVVELIIMRKPPALPGDPKGLTFPAFDDDGTMLAQRSESTGKERQPYSSISRAWRSFATSFL